MSARSGWVRGTLLALAIGPFASTAAAAPWQVSDARIVLSVALDGSMLVRETLTVQADVRHGTPYRDLPLALTANTPPSFDVDVIQVSQAGQRLPWQTEVIDGELRIHLGSPRRRIAPGSRTYELLYHVDGHLAAGGGREWLLWRPVGAGAAGAVSRLQVTVTFPRALNADDVSVAVAGGGAMTSRLTADGTVRLDANAAIAAGRGPALLVGWPRGKLLTATDSETDPWMQPRQSSLWWGVAVLAILALGAGLAGRPSPARRLLPAFALSASLASLYAAGAPAARAAATFPAEFVLALSGAAFALLARHWLRGVWLRIAYIVVVTAIAATVTVRWTVSISPWYPLLFALHADLLLLVAWRVSRAPRAPKRQAAPTPARTSAAAAPESAPLPVLDRATGAPDRDGELLPDGRRIPYFDTGGGRAPRPPADGKPPQSSSGRW